MSTAENKQLVHRFFEEFNRHNLDVADEICAPDYVLEFPGGPGTVHAPQGLRAAMTGWLTAFPNTEFVVEDLVAEGDRVACRWSMTATHQGPLGEIPGTGKPVRLGGISLFRIREGRIIEDKVRADMVGVLQQIGAIPAPDMGGL